MSKKFEPFSWIVMNESFRRNCIIEEYNVLEYYEDFVKKLKKKCETREEFADKLRREMAYSFWGKCEYEVIMQRTEDNRIILYPWILGHKNKEDFTVDVTDQNNFDWNEFYDYLNEKRWADKDGSIKVDVYEQILFEWPQFLDYVINYRHKYQREDYSVKFAKEKENNK